MSTTYTQAVLKVKQDLDLEEEDIIQDTELLSYFNQAKRSSEKIVLGIYEDYMLDSASLALVNGTSKYSLPSGIFASKIRSIVYINGTTIYEIKKIRDPRKFLERALILNANPTDYYQYIMLNNSTLGRQIELSPPSKENSASNVTVWFIRKVDAITTGADIVDKDIPESIDYIYAYVKGKCKEKENAGTMPAEAAAEILAEKQDLIDALTNMIPDDDNEVIGDFSAYSEMS